MAIDTNMNDMNSDMDMTIGGRTGGVKMKTGGKKGRAQKMAQPIIDAAQPVTDMVKAVPMPATRTLVFAAVGAATVAGLVYFLRPWVRTQLEKRTNQSMSQQGPDILGA